MSLLTLLSPKFVDREINGQPLRFYPISLYAFGKLRSAIATLASAVTTLIAVDKREAGHVVEDTTFPDGTTGSRFTQNAINPELARIRSEQRAQAISAAIETILEPKNVNALCELIMVSLRDVHPKRPNATEVDQFASTIDVPTLLQMIAGVAAANGSLFGGEAGLGKLVQDRVADALRAVSPETSGPDSSTPSSGS